MHPHESPKVMTVPLIVLAALSVLGGVLLIGDWIVDFLAPVAGTPRTRSPPLPALVISADRRRWWSPSASRSPGSSSAGARSRARRPQDVSFVTRAARADLYGDAINDALVVDPAAALVGGWLVFDRVRSSTASSPAGRSRSAASPRTLRRVQNGFVRSYALSLLGGALLVVLALLAVNLA